MNRLFDWLARGRAGVAPVRDRTEAAPQAKSAVAQGFVAMHTMLDADWTHASFAALAREGFMRNPIVHRCVRMISEAAAAVPWLVYDGATELSDHPLAAALARPNPAQSRMAFIETVFGNLLLSGNAFLERVEAVGERVHLYSLRPDRVRFETDARGWPVRCVHETIDGPRVIPVDDAGSARLLHLSLYNPLSEADGFAPLEAALMALDVHNAAAQWNKALLDNAARPSGALIYAPGDGSNLSPEQYDQLKKELEDGYSGALNAGRPLLLEGGLDWKAMGLTPRDMDFIEAKNSASRDIALAFGVPPMLLGIPGDNTYSNYQEAQRAFYRLTVLPLLRRTTEEIGHWLAPLYAGRVRIDVDLDQVEGLAAERDALWARLEGASFLTDAEKRAAVGYSPEP
ncbi:phage portal protein [Roseitalea porphyridii]|uniref:Phage portal protein n=1 Tax=Roseitalea porphyridii TaxID=1852022 RepID=A0A4P6UY87_9HYPH|nr:phage portal protein [Roseitalea porphyridii]QBK30087.1 phage portal protein [Roseitalea porphyridii]